MIDKSARKVYKNDIPIELNIKEYELLLLLVGKNAGQRFCTPDLWVYSYSENQEKIDLEAIWIKRYGKALEDGLYPTDDERMNAYHQIGEKAEFYLKELVRRIETSCGEKCALRKLFMR